MKMSNKHLKNIKTLKESGFTLKTILNLSESNINRLVQKVQNLKENTLSDLHRQKADALEKLSDLTADIETAKSQEETNEETELDVDNMGNPEWEQKDNGKVKQGLLDGEEVEIDEVIMYGGAPETQTSFYNPDAAGFQSQGPMDSYGQFDSEGFAGQQNEGALPEDETKYDYFKRYQHNLNSDLEELGEDTEQIDVGDASKGEYTQTPTQQQAPDGMGDGGDAGSRGMGILEKLMREEAVSKSQKRFWCFVKSCKESKFKDCGKGNEIKDAAKNTTNKEINLYCDTDDSGLPEKLSEAFDKEITSLVESYENKSFTKGELIETIREASFEYEEATTMPMPTTTPTTTPTKTPTRKRPGRKTPYQPKHKPKPKAKSTDTEENMPDWLNFDSIFVDEKE
jgi:hypothetical protein|tara:strand:- start:1603 stop:2796 length:1194 start_codon:yes stop_codon:yes gene_type:complete